MSYLDELQITHNDDATVTIAGDIPYDTLAKHRSSAIEQLGKDVEIDGFRKGNVPEAMLVEKIGEMNILSEMAERALAEVYPDILSHHEIDAVGYPQVSVTKLAPENDLGVSITVAIVPTIELPDYTTIAAGQTPESSDATVTDEEIETATKDILRRKVAYERLQQKAAQNTEEKSDGTTDLPTPETVGEGEDAPTGEPTDAELPELTNEVVATLGNFDSVDAFREQVRSELAEQKQRDHKNKHRAAITDALVEATPITVPQVMIDAELEQFTAQMKDDLTRAQLTMEEYLAHINKSEEDLKNEWKPAAEKRAKVQLVLDAIANAEGIEPDQALIDEQVTALKQQHPNADEARVRTYVRTILRNEAVMQKLEGEDAAAQTEPETAAATTEESSDEASEK